MHIISKLSSLLVTWVIDQFSNDILFEVIYFGHSSKKERRALNWIPVGELCLLNGVVNNFLNKFFQSLVGVWQNQTNLTFIYQRTDSWYWVMEGTKWTMFQSSNAGCLHESTDMKAGKKKCNEISCRSKNLWKTIFGWSQRFSGKPAVLQQGEMCCSKYVMLHMEEGWPLLGLLVCTGKSTLRNSIIQWTCPPFKRQCQIPSVAMVERNLCSGKALGINDVKEVSSRRLEEAAWSCALTLCELLQE